MEKRRKKTEIERLEDIRKELVNPLIKLKVKLMKIKQ